ncbi:MAG: TrkA C-terminal domain-containing protein [Dehalococcoidia bacterium]
MTLAPSDETLVNEEQSVIAAERGPHLLLAGTSFLAHQLFKQLPHAWKITLVSLDTDDGQDAAEFETIRGDPTSALVLQRAGATEARAILAALPDLEANLEICRIARQQLHLPQVITIVRAADDLGPFQELGVEIIVNATVVATAAGNLLERGSTAVEGSGLGQGELIQTTLQPSSPVVGRRIRSFHREGWTFAAIYRQDQLILPTDNTMLEADDRLLLVGRPDRLRDIADYLRVGQARFPLPYGTTLLGPVWGEPSLDLLHELAYVAGATSIEAIEVTVCGSDPAWRSAAETIEFPVRLSWASTSRSPEDAVSELLRQPARGCLFVPHQKPRLPRPFSGVTLPLQRALDQAHMPVLIPRGSFPYERVLLPVFRSPLPQGAVQAAFDLSEQLHASLITLHVQAPSALEEHSDDTATIGAALDEQAALRRARVQHERRSGNPIAEISRLAGPNQLAVISHRRGRRWRSLRPDISSYLAQRLQNSALILPSDPS